MKGRSTSTKVHATRDKHPSEWHTPRSSTARPRRSLAVLTIPRDTSDAEVEAGGGRRLHLSNLLKPFWPELGITKGDLLRYYAELSPLIVPHLTGRAMVMKRYPNGAAGDFFFMKRAPTPRPPWIEICSIAHASANVIDFPVVADVASLLWIVNLGCIDLNPWYARCDDVDRPDYLHFDLDPGPHVQFDQVREVALLVRDGLASLKMRSFAKTSGSKGMHVYVPIVRGPTQKQVWSVAKQFALIMQSLHPDLITAEYRIAKRPSGRVLVDYNQNAWGRTLASVYSVRPTARATVSAPVTWKEIERGIDIDNFRLDNMPRRLASVGDLWEPLLDRRRRVRLDKWL